MKKLKIRRIVASIARVFASGYGSCLCCGMPWRFCRYHITPLDGGRGMFPLCEHCWRNLTPTERLQYYFELRMKWIARGENPPSWTEVRTAVRRGL